MYELNNLNKSYDVTTHPCYGRYHPLRLTFFGTSNTWPDYSSSTLGPQCYFHCCLSWDTYSIRAFFSLNEQSSAGTRPLCNCNKKLSLGSLKPRQRRSLEDWGKDLSRLRRLSSAPVFVQPPSPSKPGESPL